jgi:hypothetical protein
MAERMKRRTVRSYRTGAYDVVRFNDRAGWYVARTDAAGRVRILWPVPYRSLLTAQTAIRSHPPPP